mgnify:CR=1 FL=1
MPQVNLITEISPEKLQSWIEEDINFLLIDTLAPEYHERVHIPQAQNCCVFQVTFPNRIEEITTDKHTPMVLYGANAGTMDAQSAAEKLHRSGYENIYILAGGIEGWRDAGLPLQGDAAALDEETQHLQPLQEGRYLVDPTKSSVVWAGRNPASRHYGNIVISAGELRVKKNEVSGDLHIDMNSITNINLEGDELQPVLVSHLKSDDFFDTDLYPSAQFEISGSTPLEENYRTSPNFGIQGRLNLKGKWADLIFPATINRLDDGSLTLEAHFDIDRTRWGVIYGSTRFFKHLGMHLVFDHLSIELRLVAEKNN